MLTDLEWIDNTRSSELRWNVRTKREGPARGSTHVALVTLDPELKGRLTYGVKMAMLYAPSLAGMPEEYDTLVAAKEAAVIQFGDALRAVRMAACKIVDDPMRILRGDQ